MNSQKITYYECENQDCGVRFPELRDGLARERCPVCRSSVHQTLVLKYQAEVESFTSTGEISPLMEGLLDNIRSGFNVGAILRTAEGIGINKLYLGGITPAADNPGVKKTALGAENIVACERVYNGVEKIRLLRASGYSVWGLESDPKKDSLYTLSKKIPAQPLVLVVGNEICGIDPEILDQCDRTVFIPMVGRKRSYNVAIAFGIAASYLRYCQILSQESESILPNPRPTP